MTYKVCLLSAGKGTRVDVYPNLHKALLPLGDKPAISHIIRLIPDNIPIVIALGYQAEQVKSYLDFVYPNKNIEYIYVDKWEGRGSGPGYSLLQCKDSLQCPFVFTAVDSIVKQIPIPDHDWIGVASVSAGLNYCLVSSNLEFYYNPKVRDPLAFIGMAGINNYIQFWENLSNTDTINGEHQVINGFKDLDVQPKRMHWNDIGDNYSYETLRDFYKPTVFPKRNEALYLDNGKVIKFFSDKSVVELRVERSRSISNSPNVVRLSDHLYGYDYINGRLLSNIYEYDQLDQFIELCKTHFKPYEECDIDKFKSNCKLMYYDKLYSRLSEYNFGELDKIDYINGLKVEKLNIILDKLDWNNIVNNGIPFIFHGDFQPENIIYDDVNNKFMLIDWRDSFGNEVNIGDMYYDLSKLYHGLYVNGNIMKNNHFHVKIDTQNKVSLYCLHKSNLVDLKHKFLDFCKEMNFDIKKIEILSALHYISIAPLYDNKKYSDFLFFLGKILLTQAIR